MYNTLAKVVTHPWFERTILLIIALNSLALGLETVPIGGYISSQTLMLIDQLCIAAFVIEAVFKVAYYRSEYFRSGWNVFDFIVVLVALMPFSHYFSVLRALRIIRAFRLINQVPSLRRVVNALAISIPGMISTALLLLLVFFVFGVMGSKLFGASFPQWFGHLGRSMFSLFQIMTLESWSMGIVRPIKEVYPYAWAFFVPFILLSSFILLNFLIGIVVDAIANIKEDGAKRHTQETLQTNTELARLEQKLTRIEGLLEQRNEKDRN